MLVQVLDEYFCLSVYCFPFEDLHAVETLKYSSLSEVTSLLFTNFTVGPVRLLPYLRARSSSLQGDITFM